MTENQFGDTARDRLERVREAMAEACVRAGRPQDAVTLMAVTKTVEAERILPVLEAGVTCIGENRVQEYLEKKDGLPLTGVRTHLIGHLQTNKVSRIVGQVDRIDSVDSERVARAISERSRALGIVTEVLAEVNIGGEEAKSGIAPDRLEELLGQMAQMPGIRTVGLMTVPPILDTETEKRKVFSKMYQLFLDMRDKKIDNIGMYELSMGMSGDFREAILEGSTLVRVGSALFGARHYSR